MIVLRQKEFSVGRTLRTSGYGLKEFSKIREFVDTVKKARKFNKYELTSKELKDLGISVYEHPGMSSIDKQILESREAMRKLKKLGKKTAKGVAIGGAIAGGLCLGKKLHDTSKQKKDPRFSKRFEEVIAKDKK